MKPFPELLKEATPGPWAARWGTVREEKPYGNRVCVVSSPSGAAPEAWDGIASKRERTAELIARCSPATMKLVWEALEAVAKKTITEQDGITGGTVLGVSGEALDTQDAQLVLNALTALNGKSP